MELQRIFRFCFLWLSWIRRDGDPIQWCTQPDIVFGFFFSDFVREIVFMALAINWRTGSQSLCGNYLTTPMNNGMIFGFLFQLLSSRIRTDGFFSQKWAGNVFDSDEKQKLERNKNSSLRVRRVRIPFLCFTLPHWISFHFTHSFERVLTTVCTTNTRYRKTNEYNFQFIRSPVSSILLNPNWNDCLTAPISVCGVLFVLILIEFSATWYRVLVYFYRFVRETKITRERKSAKK